MGLSVGAFPAGVSEPDRRDHRVPPAGAHQLRQITELLLEETRRRLHSQNISVVTSAAVTWVADHGYQPELGARPMRRLIQRDIHSTYFPRTLLDAVGALASRRWWTSRMDS